MRADNADISSDERMLLLQNLQVLLERQIELINQGNIKDVEAMAGQASSLVKTITEGGIFEKPEFQNRRRQLQKLYKDLLLALAAQKAETAEEISRLHKGKKTLAIYRGNI